MNLALASTLPRDPYPGLRPFEPDEWAIFRGREDRVVQLIDLLGSHNVALVHGSSGCGKSSLVRAGVLPAIARDHALSGRPFDYAIFRPSEGPLRGLARMLAEKLGAPDGEEAHAWWSSQLIFSRRIVETIEERVKARGLDAFCLVVDQFEEVFHWIRERGDADVSVLVDLMCRIGDDQERRYFFVLMTMRSDYLGECARFPDLGTLINRCQYFLPNLDDRGLYRAIHEPARLFHGEIDQELSDRLRIEASTRQDQLPVMQHLLMRMTERVRTPGKPWRLTLKEFDEVEGTHGALSAHADAIYAQLLARHPRTEDAMEWFFRALIDLDVGGRAVRRRCTKAALVEIAHRDAAFVDDVVAAYSSQGANLLTVTDPNEGQGESIVDISHEALLRRWTRMVGESGKGGGWVRHEFQDGLLWRSMAVAARNPKAVLDPVTTIEREHWFIPFTVVPERARRYLLSAEGTKAVTEEHEWKAVSGLLARSREAVDAALERKRRKRKLVSTGLLVGMGAVLAVIAWVAQDRLETQERQSQAAATESAKKLKVLERQNAQASKLLLTEVAKGGNETVTSQVAKAIENATPAAGKYVPTSTTTPTQQVPEIAGYMWIGSDTLKKLRRGESQVAWSDVEIGGKYVSGDNIVLREGPPSRGNVSAPAVGVVPVGSTVAALAKPVPSEAASGTQYWLNVRVVASAAPPAPKLYIQHATTAVDVAKGVAAKLEKLGYAIVSLEHNDRAMPGVEVRYCSHVDDDRASRLSKQLSEFDAQPNVRFIGDNPNCRLANQGTLEVWVGAQKRIDPLLRKRMQR